MSIEEFEAILKSKWQQDFRNCGRKTLFINLAEWTSVLPNDAVTELLSIVSETGFSEHRRVTNIAKLDLLVQRNNLDVCLLHTYRGVKWMELTILEDWVD